MNHNILSCFKINLASKGNSHFRLFCFWHIVTETWNPWYFVWQHRVFAGNKLKYCTCLQHVSVKDTSVPQSPELVPRGTFTWTRAVCFPAEAEFRRSLQCFAFLSGDPSDLFNKLAEYWHTVNGHTGLEVLFFYPTAVPSLCCFVIRRCYDSGQRFYFEAVGLFYLNVPEVLFSIIVHVHTHTHTQWMKIVGECRQ